MHHFLSFSRFFLISFFNFFMFLLVRTFLELLTRNFPRTSGPTTSELKNYNETNCGTKRAHPLALSINSAVKCNHFPFCDHESKMATDLKSLVRRRAKKRSKIFSVRDFRETFALRFPDSAQRAQCAHEPRWPQSFKDP